MTSRTIDPNTNNLQIIKNLLTQENVSGYLGSELDPGGQKWGLEQNRMYFVYLPAKVLQKELKSFNGIRLLNEHLPAVDTETTVPRRGNGADIGAIGTNATLLDGKVYNTVTIWNQEAIDMVNNNNKVDLSVGKQSMIEPKQGSFKGKPYDFIVTKAGVNHVSLVKQGRVKEARLNDSVRIKNMLFNRKNKARPVILNDADADNMEALIAATVNELAGLLLDDADPKKESKTMAIKRTVDAHTDGAKALMMAGQDEADDEAAQENQAAAAEDDQAAANAEEVATSDEGMMSEDDDVTMDDAGRHAQMNDKAIKAHAEQIAAKKIEAFKQQQHAYEVALNDAQCSLGMIRNTASFNGDAGKVYDMVLSNIGYTNQRLQGLSFEAKRELVKDHNFNQTNQKAQLNDSLKKPSNSFDEKFNKIFGE